MEGYTLFCTGKYELCGSTAILHCCLPVSAQSYLFVEVYTYTVSVRIFLKMCDFVCVVKSNANETETVETAQEFWGPGSYVVWAQHPFIANLFRCHIPLLIYKIKQEQISSLAFSKCCLPDDLRLIHFVHWHSSCLPWSLVVDHEDTCRATNVCIWIQFVPTFACMTRCCGLWNVPSQTLLIKGKKAIILGLELLLLRSFCHTS